LRGPEAIAEATRRAYARPLLALLLIAPVPSIGALSALLLGDNPLGVVIWGVSKAWLLLFPILWHMGLARGPVNVQRPTAHSLWVGAATGTIIAAIILGAYGLVGRHLIDPGQIREVLRPLGLLDPWVYTGVALYWIAINSALEEYVYRWFVFTRCRVLMRDALAVGVAGLVFVAHHVIVLSAYFDWQVTVVACIGVFIGGVVWSVQYLVLGNIWGSVLSHAITDVAVFGIGAVLLFG
jgi:membrane protease YdiL (CAAX protease family)